MSPDVVPLDPGADTERDAAALHRLLTEALAVDRPEDPPPSLEEVAGRLRVRRDDRRTLRWVVRAGDAIVGHLVLGLPGVDNTHLGLFYATVHPDHRRRGTGTALLRAAVATAAAEGRRSLAGETEAGTPGE
jgi:GNAT superfamily N-acetyltransferase